MLDRIRYVTSGALLAALLTLGVYHPPVHAATLLPNGEQTFVDENGKPLAAGCVYFYVPGTNTPKDTWVNPGGTATNTNPVTLDAAGRAIIYGVGTYRQVVKKYPCGSLGEQVWDQLTADTASSTTIFAGASAGTPNAITVIAPAFTGEDGQVINYISTNTNTGGATINPSGFGNVQIVRGGSSGPGALVGGELVATNAVSLIYDATAGVFHILSPVTWPNTSGVPVGTVIAHAGFTAPTNYAFAYGQAVSRTTYSALFSTLTSQQTGSISSGSPTISGLADTSQLGYGMAVEATGISPGTTILSCTSSTCTMSGNASVTRSGTMTFFAYGAGDGSLTFNLPDYRGVSLSGRDNMGGSPGSRLQVTSATLTTVSASSTATVSSTSGLAIGMAITSANVVPGTTITDIPSTVTGATVATGGSGGANGAVVLTVVGGTGTAATINGTISGGALTAITTVATPGSYTYIPPNPVQVTGGGLSGATVNLTVARTTITMSAPASATASAAAARFSALSDAQVLGVAGGSMTHVAAANEAGPHAHPTYLNDPGHSHGVTNSSVQGVNSGVSFNAPVGTFGSGTALGTTNTATTGITLRSATGGGGTINTTTVPVDATNAGIVLNPTRIVNYIVRLTP